MDHSELFNRLAQSKFRSSFYLKEKDKAYENGQRMSDRQLVKKFQSASGMKKIGYALVLEERGYYTRNSEGKLVRTSKRLD